MTNRRIDALRSLAETSLQAVAFISLVRDLFVEGTGDPDGNQVQRRRL
jgi:hypothetical protein